MDQNPSQGDFESDCGVDFSPNRKRADGSDASLWLYDGLPGVTSVLEGVFSCQTDGVEQIRWHPNGMEQASGLRSIELNASNQLVGVPGPTMSSAAQSVSTGFALWLGHPQISFSVNVAQVASVEDVGLHWEDDGSSVQFRRGPSTVDARALARANRHAPSPDNLTVDLTVYRRAWAPVRHDPLPKGVTWADTDVLEEAVCSDPNNGLLGYCRNVLWVSTDAELLSANPLVRSLSYSLESILRHETAHALGLGHSAGDHSNVIMVESATPGELLNNMHDDECETMVYLNRDTDPNAPPSRPDVCR